MTRVAGEREEFRKFLRNYDRTAEGSGSDKRPPVDKMSRKDLKIQYESGRDRGLSRADAAEDVLVNFEDVRGKTKYGSKAKKYLKKLRGFAREDDDNEVLGGEPDQQVGVNPIPGQPYEGPLPEPNLFGIPEGGEGIFTGGIPADKSYFDFIGGDPANPRSYSTFGQDGPIGLARLDPPVRTANFGVPIGMPTFRGNVGMPEPGMPSEVDGDSGESEQEGSYSGSSFLDGVLAGLVPTLGPAIGTGLGNLFGDVLQGEPEQQVSINPIFEGTVGDFGPFGSETVAMSRNAAGTLGNILNAFTGSVMA